jgi:hypothetical protein
LARGRARTSRPAPCGHGCSVLEPLVMACWKLLAFCIGLPLSRDLRDLTDPQQVRPALGNNSSTRAVVPSCAKTEYKNRIQKQNRGRPREKGIDLDRGLSVPGGTWGCRGERRLTIISAAVFRSNQAKGCSDGSAPLSPLPKCPHTRKEKISNSDVKLRLG